MGPRSLGHLAGIAAGCLSTAAAAGPGVNQFEMKDLDSAPGEMQFQSQNAISFGQPKRKLVETAPGQFAFDDNTAAKERYALEMQMGITTWFRIRLGVEFEKDRLDDPELLARANTFNDLQLTSVAMEGVLVFVPVKKQGVGFGLLVEFDDGIRGGGRQLYAGPIIQAVTGPWTGLANLLMVQHFGSPDRFHHQPEDRSVDFAYALQLQYEVSQTWAVALEGYGTFDRISPAGNQAQTLAWFGRFDQHRAGPVVYYRCNPGAVAHTVKTGAGGVKGLDKDKDDDDKPGVGVDKETSVSIGVGLLFGLNDNSPKETLKLSLEYNF